MASPLAVAQDSGDDVRTWRDASGRNEVVAKLLEVVDGKVRLRKADGRVVTPPIRLLSREDQEFISAWEHAKSDGNIFAGGVTEPMASDETVKTEPVNAVEKGNAGQASLLPWRVGTKPLVFEDPVPILIRETDAPQLTPDPPAVLETSDDAEMFAIAKLESGENVGPQIIVDPRRKRAVHTAWRRATEGKPGSARLMMIDPRNRRAVEVATWPEEVRLCDADLGSGRLVGRAKIAYWGETRELIVYSCGSAGRVRELIRWYPTKNSESKPSRVSRVRMLDDHHVYARVGDTIVLWDIARRRTVWSLNVGRFHNTAISRGGRYVAAQKSDFVAIIETLTGKQLGALKLPSADPVDVAWSVDGTKLAAVGGPNIHVFDLANEAVRSTVEMPEPIDTFHSDPVWMDNEHLLLNKGRLVDPRTGVVIWQYNLGHFAEENRHFLTGMAKGLKQGDGHLVAMTISIPHSEALQAKQVLDMQAAVRLDRGDAVGLDIETGRKVDQTRVREAMEKAIVDAGWKLDASATKRVSVRVFRGPEREGDYGSRAFRDQKLPCRPFVGVVEITDDGVPIWRVVDRGRPPSNMKIAIDETPAEAIERQTLPNYRFVEDLNFPDRILDPSLRMGLGASMLGSEGFVDQGFKRYEFPAIPESSGD